MSPRPGTLSMASLGQSTNATISDVPENSSQTSVNHVLETKSQKKQCPSEAKAKNNRKTSTNSPENSNEKKRTNTLRSPLNSDQSEDGRSEDRNTVNTQEADSTVGDDDDNENSNLNSSVQSEMNDNDNDDDDAGGVEMSINPQRILLKSINDHISCNLCKGYLIDATTIVECLHSFCRSCIMEHLKKERSCPHCKMMINTVKPNIKSDTTLQAIVYKLVPGLYEKELMRKRAFYRDRPKEAMLATPEQRGDDTEYLIFGPAEHMSLSLEYADVDNCHIEDKSGLKTPKYLQCPAIFSVAHLKKFILYKFAIDNKSFYVEIMYKVKTIVLPDHYTLMDVAYIYTWKRDAPMRFFFRVKESTNASHVKALNNQTRKIKRTTNSNCEAKCVKSETYEYDHKDIPIRDIKIVLHERVQDVKCVDTTIKKENNTTMSQDKKHFNADEKKLQVQITPLPAIDEHNISPKTEKIKLTLVNKNKLMKNNSVPFYESNMDKSFSGSTGTGTGGDSGKGSKTEKSSSKNGKPSKNHHSHHVDSNSQVKPIEHDDRKVENIKLKIDLSKQGSVTIINMSSPSSESGKKENGVKVSKSDKEWKLKSRKDKDESGKTPNSILSLKRSKLEKAKDTSPPSNSLSSTTPVKTQKDESDQEPPSNDRKNDLKIEQNEEEKKSEFLNSFALTPIKSNGSNGSNSGGQDKTPRSVSDKVEAVKKCGLASLINSCSTQDNQLPKTPSSQSLNTSPTKSQTNSNKRKNKDTTKTMTSAKRLKTVPIKSLLASAESKHKSPSKDGKGEPQSITFKLAPFPIGGSQSPPSIDLTKDTDEKLMPAPPPLKVIDLIKRNGLKKGGKTSKSSGDKPDSTNSIGYSKPMYPPNSLLNGGGSAIAPPGSRTPTTRRYPFILPKSPRPNPFANIAADVNKILSGNDIDFKQPLSTFNCDIKHSTMGASHDSQAHNKISSTSSLQSVSSANLHKLRTPVHHPSYLNFALLNATKTKMSDALAGSRTPMYTPNSPIYSPNSPQYMPNYNIPTQPTYKYTKSQTTSYLSSVLGQNQQLSGLFPGPPVKKNTDMMQGNNKNQNVAPPNSGHVEPGVNNVKPEVQTEKPTHDTSSGKATDVYNNNRDVQNNNTNPGIVKKQTNNSFNPIDSTMNVSKTDEMIQNKMTKPSDDNQIKRSPPFHHQNIINIDLVNDPPEKEANVKSLLNSCKINIPSSLSITITTEEGDAQMKNSNSSKLKSPVNNYIEILKLPENQPIKADLNGSYQNSQILSLPTLDSNVPQKLQTQSDVDYYTSKITVANDSTMQKITINVPKSSPSAVSNGVLAPKMNVNAESCNVTSPTDNRFGQKRPAQQMSPEKKVIVDNDVTPKKHKSTPSPEIKNRKSSSDHSQVSPTKVLKTENSDIKSEVKQNNSPNLATPQSKDSKVSKENEKDTSPPAKKFRPILPRTDLSGKEIAVQNVKTSPQSALVTSSTGVNNTNSKVSPTKAGKTGAKTQKTNRKNCKNSKNNSPEGKKPVSGKKSEEIVDLTEKSSKAQNTSPPPPTSDKDKGVSSHVQRILSNLSKPKDTDRPVDMANILEKSLRAQLQSNNDIYLSNLAAAASFNPHFASVNLGYNIQQAMLLEQFTRMQKAGRDALEKYLESTKNKTDTNSNANSVNNQTSPTTTTTTTNNAITTKSETDKSQTKCSPGSGVSSGKKSKEH